MKDKIGQGMANLLLLITALVWGSGFVGTQLALDANLSPIQVICGRMLVASVVLNIAFRKKLKGISKNEIKAGAIIGLCMFMGFIFQTYGLTYTTSSINAFVTATYVVMIPFIKLVFFKSKPDVYSVVGALLTVMGVGLISLNGFEISLGIPLTFICAIFFALQVIFTDKYTKEYDPIRLTVIMMNINFLLGLVGVIFSAASGGGFPAITAGAVGSLLYLGIVCTFVAYLCQNVGQKYTKDVQAAIILSLESVFGSLLSVIILKEDLTAQMFIGCGLIFAAIIISETKLKFVKRPAAGNA